MGSVGSWTEVNTKSVKKMWGYTECKGSLSDVAPLSDPGTRTAGNKELKTDASGVDVGKTYNLKVEHPNILKSF
jgi:hypothetical protein